MFPSHVALCATIVDTLLIHYWGDRRIIGLLQIFVSSEKYRASVTFYKVQCIVRLGIDLIAHVQPDVFQFSVPLFTLFIILVYRYVLFYTYVLFREFHGSLFVFIHDK